jgi:AAA15 family ATPase/GTPase
MLIAFKVNNFLSFGSEQRISMIPTGDDKGLITLNQIKLLRSGIIFGANSSGKSNFIKALAFGREVIINYNPEKSRHKYSKINAQNRDKESSFEYTFFNNGSFYTYGFSIILYHGKVVSEYLYSINQDDVEELIFERELGNVKFLKPMNEKEKEAFEKVKDTKRLLLYEVSNLKGNAFKAFYDAYNWFERRLKISFQDQPYLRLESDFLKDKERFLKLLMNFDTGITALYPRKTNLDFLEKLDENIRSEIEADLRLHQPTHKPFGIRLKNNLYYVAWNEGKAEVYEIYLKHFYSELEYEFGEESDGTKRLFDLMDIIISPISNSLYLIDEINRSFHPLLTERYIETFQKNLHENNVQIIFTTHEANLLREGLLRSDEIWFLEKQKDNSSKLFSLDIFQKEGKDVFTSYLEGRYGGIPLLQREDD